MFAPVVSAVKKYNLLREFVLREIKGRFAGSFAGTLWTLVHPVANICIYIFLFSLVLRISVTVEDTGTDSFAIFFLAGFFPWLFLAETLGKAPGILIGNASLITRVVFPVELLPLASCGAVFITNGIGFVIFLIFLAVKTGVYLSWLWVVPLVFLQFLFVMGVVCFVSAASVFVRDFAELVPLIVMVWFYGTPVIYPVSMVPESLHPLLGLNPMALFIELYRGVLLLHRIDPLAFVQVAIISFLSYAVGAWLFMRLKPAFGDVL
ncbi:MAG: ABC transporter permease [Desulfobacterium sp.]|nr:ABC transporter permease [Desulfobacterium sp.]